MTHLAGKCPNATLFAQSIKPAISNNSDIVVIQTVTNNFQNYCNIVEKTKKLVSAVKNVDKFQSVKLME